MLFKLINLILNLFKKLFIKHNTVFVLKTFHFLVSIFCLVFQHIQKPCQVFICQILAAKVFNCQHIDQVLSYLNILLIWLNKLLYLLSIIDSSYVFFKRHCEYHKMILTSIWRNNVHKSCLWVLELKSSKSNDLFLLHFGP